ncbi:hypothetical protein B7767_29225 [Streptomyces sp. 13-12-16]|nr:hypothetical protein B7767_29225 [Streptomyces sp. 13-12-16]
MGEGGRGGTLPEAASDTPARRCGSGATGPGSGATAPAWAPAQPPPTRVGTPQRTGAESCTAPPPPCCREHPFPRSRRRPARPGPEEP